MSCQSAEEFFSSLERDTVDEEDKPVMGAAEPVKADSKPLRTTIEDFSAPRRPKTGLRGRY